MYIALCHSEMSIDSDRESFVESEVDKDQEEVNLDFLYIYFLY